MNVSFPLRAAFYYPWFPETTFGRYTPTLGRYSTDDVIEQHVKWLAWMRVRVAIASWWGGNTHNEQNRIPALLDASAKLNWPIAWTIYFEHGDASTAEIAAGLAYLGRYTTHPRWAHIDGKPVVFIYNTSGGETISDRWATAAPEWFYVPKLFEGWRDASPQPPSWHQYGPSTSYQEHSDASGTMISSAISDGFWRADEAQPRLARDFDRYKRDLDRQIASKARWQIITTFNEFGEGTAIEPTTDWGTSYIDLLHAKPYR